MTHETAHLLIVVFGTLNTLMILGVLVCIRIQNKAIKALTPKQ